MNKKFASFGTALSRDEAKKVMGGGWDQEEDALSGDLASCSTTCKNNEGKDYTVSCSGANSAAQDGTGCYSNSESKKC
ncbi:MAG: hypothetical protein MUE72_05440 [Chitinophagaceae bacterium]|jgi:hypothetical protein|nr:hypothetical protein [Chitinophagaceae bacterium]